MSACATQTFEAITPTVWTCVIQKAATYGITITTPIGQAAKDGFSITWNYNTGTKTLALQCLESPWWAPCGTINGKIHDLVDACRQHPSRSH
jgi:hypothetical protein